VKNKYIDITREDWTSLISLDKNNPINKKLGAKFICQEEIKKTEETILYRICIEDIKSKRLFCVKYILFKDSEGKPDIAVNTEYTDKLYKI
jgi:hypothetical protein